MKYDTFAAEKRDCAEDTNMTRTEDSREGGGGDSKRNLRSLIKREIERPGLLSSAADNYYATKERN